MKQLPLGIATVTAVGCGDVRLATAAARGIEPREVERGLAEALELGITLVDVADEEAAERLCGDAVRALRLRDRVTTATRVPVHPPRAGVLDRDLLPDRLPARHVQDRVEASLRATRFDALPLAQLPLRAMWRDASAWPELAGTCARLQREGKVLQWGAIVSDLERATELSGEPWLVSLQVTFNACTRAAEPILAELRGKLAILARSPLAGGALAGTLGPGVKLAPNDDRAAIDARMFERIAVAIARIAPYLRREPPAARSCDAARAALERTPRPPDVDVTTAAELALRYVIDHDAIALPRLHRSAHIAESIAAAAARPLPGDLRALLDEVFARVDT